MSQSPPRTTSPLRGLQFSLASALLTMTFVSVCLAVFQFGAEAGLILLFFAVPAFVRTVIIIFASASRGSSITLNGRFLEMMFSLLLMVPIYCVGAIGFGVGAGIAMLLAQMRLVELDQGFILAPLLGLVATVWIWSMTLRVSQIDA